MTSGSNRPEDGLGERLRELDAADAPQSGERMDRMFTAMKARCDKNDRTITGFLRSRSTTVRRLIEINQYPRPFFVGKSAVFVRAELDAWVKSRIAARDKKLAAANGSNGKGEGAEPP